MAKNRELWKKANLYSEARDKLAKDIVNAGDVATGINYANKYPKYIDDMFALMKNTGTASDVIKWINTIGVTYYSAELINVFLSKINGTKNKKNSINALNNLVEAIYNCEKDKNTSASDKIIVDNLLVSLMGLVMNSNNPIILLNWLKVLGATKYVNNKNFITYLTNFYSSNVDNSNINNFRNNFTLDLISIMMDNKDCEYVREFKIFCVNNGSVDIFIEMVRILPPYSYSVKDFYSDLPKEYELGIVL